MFPFYKDLFAEWAFYTMHAMLIKNGVPVQALKCKDGHEFTWQEMGVSRFQV